MTGALGARDRRHKRILRAWQAPQRDSQQAHSACMAGNTSAGVTTSALGVGEKPWVLTDGGKEREGRERN